MKGLQPNYFILDSTKDDAFWIASRFALREFAEKIRHDNRELANNIMTWVHECVEYLDKELMDAKIMTIDEHLDWMISIEKCSDNLVNEDVRKMVAHHARIIKELLKRKVGLHLMERGE